MEPQKTDLLVPASGLGQGDVSMPPIPLVPKSPEPLTPPAHPFPPVPPPAYDPSVGGKSHKGLIVFIVLIVIILGLAGGAYAMVYMVTPARVMSTLAKIDHSSKIHGDIKFALDADNESFKGSAFSISTNADKTANGNPKIQTSLDLSSPQFSASAEIRYLDGVIYGSVKELPEKYLSTAKEGTQFAIGKWFSVSLDTLKKLQESNSSIPTTTPDAKYKELANIYDKLNTEGVLKTPKFIGIAKESGKFVRKYEMAVDKEALGKLLSSLAAKEVGNNAEYGVGSSMILGSTLSAVEISPVIISVSLITSDLRQVIWHIGVSDELKKSTQGISGLTTTINYDKSQNNFTIMAPEGAIALDSFIMDSLNASRQKGAQARVTSELSQARIAAEVYYDKSSSYSGMCTKDATIQTLFTDINSNGFPTTCKAITRSYVMTVKLTPIAPATTTTYYCVDSKGLSTTLKKLPTAYVCK